MHAYDLYIALLEADSTGVLLFANKVIKQMALNHNTSLVGASACRILMACMDEGILERASVNSAKDS
jgi:hypothetical protein